MRRPALPAYIDGLIAAYRAGHTGRDLHLGYWDQPPDLGRPCSPGEFAVAQARLTERIVGGVPLKPGHRVLDVACGLGGTLATLGAHCSDLALVGLNIDLQQLELCRDIAPPAHGRLSLVQGDACALPFTPASYDHVFCVEAVFHFRSREIFLHEAARVLRPGGLLVLSDILLRKPGGATPWSMATIAAILRRDYGPWPEIWADAGRLISGAADAGLMLAADEDWTVQTKPSYRMTSPDDRPERRRNPDAGNIMRWLHSHGCLSYRVLVFRRR